MRGPRSPIAPAARRGLPLRWALVGAALAGLVAFSAVFALWAWTTASITQREVQTNELIGARREATRSAMLADSVRSDLLVALTGLGSPPSLASVPQRLDQMGDLTDALVQRPLPADLATQAGRFHEQMSEVQATELQATAAVDSPRPQTREAAAANLAAVGPTLASDTEDFLGQVDSAVMADQAWVSDQRRTQTQAIAIASLAALAVVVLAGMLISRGVRRRLGVLAEVAHRISGGDFTARAPAQADDEIGRIARALDRTAESQEELVGRLEADAARIRIASRMDQAFDMVDREPAAYDVVARCLARLVPDDPAELLLADASRAHLEVMATNPSAAPAGCPVGFPHDCVAIRRGSRQMFGSSDDIDACPRLVGRGPEAVSAVCAPVSFMGRALGVLHVTAPADVPWDPDRVALLDQLASMTGSKLGTIRTFERTQLQAETDGLTGLPNRRTFESRARTLLASPGPCTVALLDLDHFKLLNDAYGHEAGDRALRAFAHVVRSRVRDGDLVARIGGEEFAVLLPATTVPTALEVLDRVRAGLVDTAHGEAPAVTVSGGVVAREDMDTLDGLLRAADRALYRAKRSGRDRLVVADVHDRDDEPPPTPDLLEDAAESGLTWATDDDALSGFAAAATRDDPLPDGGP